MDGLGSIFGGGGSGNGSSVGPTPFGGEGEGGGLLSGLLGWGGTSSGSSKGQIVASTLYGLALLAFILRIYIRFAVQRTLFADDGFIIAGILLLSVSFGAFVHFRKDAFVEGDLINGNFEAILGSDIFTTGLEVRKWLTAAAILLWTAINMAKFSFLFFFRRLIVRLRWFMIYWWTVLAYLAVVWGWGVAAVLAPCPHLEDLMSALKCISGPKAVTAVHYSYVQVALDILGDLLILAIPIKLIMKVKIRWSQKIALTTSLCLSIAMVGTSAARAAGILRHGYLDSLWILFWLFVSASIGMMLSCAAAFRTLYVAQQAARRQNRPQRYEAPGTSQSTTCVSGLKSQSAKIIDKMRTLSRSDRQWPSADGREGDRQEAGGAKSPTESQRRMLGGSSADRKNKPLPPIPPQADMRELPQPPQAVLTGMRTYIRRNGRDSIVLSTHDPELTWV